MPNQNDPPETEPIEPLVGHAQLTAKYELAGFSNTKRTRFYANHVTAAFTLFDVRLILSSVHVEKDRVEADETLDVMMSPELAALLVRVMAEGLQSYITTYGNLRGMTAQVTTGPLEAESPTTADADKKTG